MQRKNFGRKWRRGLALMIACVTLAFGALSFTACDMVEDAFKQIFQSGTVEKKKEELNQAITKSLNDRGTDLASVDVTYFDWKEENKDYFFLFTGTAITNDGETIDFFSVTYKVNERLYTEVVDYIQKNQVNDLEDIELLKKFTQIVENCTITDSNLIESIPGPEIYVPTIVGGK